MEDIQEQPRFLFNGDDTTINLIPGFSAYLLGVAAFAVLTSQVLNTDILKARSEPGRIAPDLQLQQQQQLQLQQQHLQQPQQQLQQLYQPAATAQPVYYQEEERQPYQGEYHQYQQLQGQNNILDNQEYTTNQEQVDIYRKLVNLQEELRKLQEAEKLLSTALSRRYTNVGV